MLRAKAHYFVGWSLKMRDYVPVLYIARICVELPVLRSVSAPGKLASRISATDVPSLRRFHVDDWWPDDMPISRNLFSTVTHLSLNARTSKIDALHELEWAPLKHLTVLKFFMLHTHFSPHRRFDLNESHAGSWIDLMNQRFFPSISMSVELIVWVIPDIDMDASLSHYQALLDGSLDRRFVVAFEKGDGLRTHATSENAGAGPYAFVYPPLSRKKSVGLDWLEWLWEEGLEFLENREAVALESHTC
ncbi:hypothetical protein DL96DRAFT_1609264 [Flagelloscypha sp. PMI_526]|nr:hypothetical protein DL96DRAFT_1609264 [Flagelloscypha sp. PMI_526]